MDEMAMMGVEGLMKKQSTMTLIMEVGYGAAFSFGPANLIVQTLLEQPDYLTAEHEMVMAAYFVLQELDSTDMVRHCEHSGTQKLRGGGGIASLPKLSEGTDLCKEDAVRGVMVETGGVGGGDPRWARVAGASRDEATNSDWANSRKPNIAAEGGGAPAFGVATWCGVTGGGVSSSVVGSMASVRVAEEAIGEGAGVVTAAVEFGASGSVCATTAAPGVLGESCMVMTVAVGKVGYSRVGDLCEIRVCVNQRQRLKMEGLTGTRLEMGQVPYYCGMGADKAFECDIVDSHSTNSNDENIGDD
nr:hypothetical protein Iba_chr03cCG5220 [Ipomoea batatas]